MLNYETLLSSYDDKLTLMQWLKKVEAALKGASAVSFKVNKRGDSTLTFSVLFEDGSELETAPIILQQGESVQGATIRNGHLILTLTNGDELDAGDLGAVSGFSIDASQHLIVTYQNGTTQDLGAIFTGDVTLAGNLTATAVKTASLTSDEDEISAQKPVVEVMAGFEYSKAGIPANITISYASVCKNGNKLTFAVSGTAQRSSDYSSLIGRFFLPAAILNKLVPVSGNYIASQSIYLWTDAFTQGEERAVAVQKSSNLIGFILSPTSNLTEGMTYNFRFEFTCLLSDNLVA